MKSLKPVLAIAAFFCLSALTLNGAIFTEDEISSSFGMKDLEAKPEPTKQVQPKVTPELEGETGRVYVAFIVSEKGKVQGLRCVKSTSEKLEQPVLDAVAGWKFKPGKSDGTNVAVRVVLPIRIDFT